MRPEQEPISIKDEIKADILKQIRFHRDQIFDLQQRLAWLEHPRRPIRRKTEVEGHIWDDWEKL